MTTYNLQQQLHNFSARVTSDTRLTMKRTTPISPCVFKCSPGTSSSSSSTVAIGAFPSTAVEGVKRCEQHEEHRSGKKQLLKNRSRLFQPVCITHLEICGVYNHVWVITGHWPCLGRASASLLRLVRLSAPSWFKMPGSISVNCLVSAWPVIVKVLAVREACTLGLLKWMTVPWFVNMFTCKTPKFYRL